MSHRCGCEAYRTGYLSLVGSFAGRAALDPAYESCHSSSERKRKFEAGEEGSPSVSWVERRGKSADCMFNIGRLCCDSLRLFQIQQWTDRGAFVSSFFSDRQTDLPDKISYMEVTCICQLRQNPIDGFEVAFYRYWTYSLAGTKCICILDFQCNFILQSF